MAEYREPEFKILQHVADLSTPNKQGINTQVNIVSWGKDGKFWAPVVDIRKWAEDENGNRSPLKGVTIRPDEFKQLLSVNPADFEDIFTKYEQQKIQQNRQKNNFIHNANRFNQQRHGTEND